jgi:hypothetical protein
LWRSPAANLKPPHGKVKGTRSWCEAIAWPPDQSSPDLICGSYGISNTFAVARPHGTSRPILRNQRRRVAGQRGCEPKGRRGVSLSRRDFTFCVVVATAAACWTPSAFALDPRYPDWPCQQLKVPGISIASVWSGPSIETVDKTEPADPQHEELVARLAARRTPMEEARKLIAGFVVGTNREKQDKAKSLFAALYSRLDAQRDQVMNGIERFSRKQKAMAEEIREETQKIRDLQDKPNPDQAESDDLASRLSWQTRIFEDRRKSTSYVCDVPVLIEKRLFDLAAAIQSTLNSDPQAK